MATDNFSTEDKDFLAQCEEDFKDRYTEKDEEFMKIFNAEQSCPPIIENWWVPQKFGHRNERRNNRRFNSYEHTSNRHNQDRGYQDRGYQDRGYQDRGYQDRSYQDRGHQDHKRKYDNRGYQNRDSGVDHSKKGRYQ